MNQMVKNKNKDNNSSNSLVFGRWPQTKIEAFTKSWRTIEMMKLNYPQFPFKELLASRINHSCQRRRKLDATQKRLLQMAC